MDKSNIDIIEERIIEFKVFERINGTMMMCKFCRKIIDHNKKSTIKDHLSCLLHINKVSKKSK